MEPEKKLRVHYLQHVPFEGLGCIEPYLHNRGHRLTATRLYKNDPLPPRAAFDWLIVMGGPMGVADDARYPWLAAEKIFIREAVAAGKVLLGICLGAQLAASALGAKVRQNRHREIGWFTIERTAEASQTAVGKVLPRQMEVFHWHGDTFETPRGAVRLATSAACSNQGFAIENRIVGLQFHLETTPDTAGQLIANCRHELVNDRFVQSEKAMMSNPKRFDRINRLMREILGVLERQAQQHIRKATGHRRAGTHEIQSTREATMIKLRDKHSGATMGSISEQDLQFLIDHLEEEHAGDRDYYLNRTTFEMLKREGAGAGLLAILEPVFAGREAIEIEWHRD